MKAVKDLYEKWKDNPQFLKLFEKINNIQTRDEVWALKEQKEREIQSLGQSQLLKHILRHPSKNR